MIVKHSTAEIQTLPDGQEPVWLKKAKETEEETQKVATTAEAEVDTVDQTKKD